jgi:hypothetical protein
MLGVITSFARQKNANQGKERPESEHTGLAPTNCKEGYYWKELA